MALTGRAALLALLGVLWVGLVQPGWAGIGGWLLVLLAVVALDLVLAGSPRAVALARNARQGVRLGGAVTTTLTLRNDGRRRGGGPLPDARQPSAGATADPHRLGPAAGGRGRGPAPPAPAPRGAPAGHPGAGPPPP